MKVWPACSLVGTAEGVSFCWSAVGPMARYFFHIRAGGELIEDPDGIELPDISNALDQCRRLVQEALAEDEAWAELSADSQVEIVDERRVGARDVVEERGGDAVEPEERQPPLFLAGAVGQRRILEAEPS